MTSVILWAGRFLFLALLYTFMFQLYRALVTSSAGARAATAAPRPRTASVTLVSVARDGEVWVEEAAEKERRLEQGESVEFQDRLEIGRIYGNRVRIVDPYVSARHCVIERQGALFILQDLSTTNGTAIDGRPASGDSPLRSGALIEVGATRFRFETR